MTLVTQNLSFQWGEDTTFLGPFNFEFKKGSITAVLGTNGSGKSTLLNIFSQRLVKYEGLVTVNGNPAETKDFNYMLQKPERILFSHMTMAQNLLLSKGGERDIKSCVDIIPIFFNDESALKKYPWQCSIGQRQRLVLMRAIMDISNFAVTLLDEPFSSISRDSKKVIYEQIRGAVVNKSVVLIFVTHDLSEACLLSDNVIILDDGKTSLFDVSSISNEDDFINANSLRKNIQLALLG